MQSLIQRHTTLLILALFVGSLSLSGCASMSNTEKGAAAGAGAGAVVGGVIGNATGSTAQGAIIGAVLGGAAGAVIGQQMDKQAEELEDDLEGAEIERVGEGIQITFDSGILFDFDSANLRPEARENLTTLAQSLNEYPQTDVMVIGHTDSKGTEAYNQGLSERRAGSAADYLLAQGIAGSRITTLGKGESEPVADNETEAGRQENRRVEIAIYASEEYRDEVSGQN